MRKRITAVFIAGVMMLLTACSGSSPIMSSNKSENSVGYATPAPMATSVPQENYIKESGALDMVTGKGETSYSDETKRDVAEEADQKVIKTADLSLRTEDFGIFQGNLTNLVSSASGYFENLNVSVYDTVRDLRRGYITIRVPQENYARVMNGLDGIAKVMSKSESAQNVTGQYYDIESRMKAKQVEEQRLLELIEKAQRISDLIELEQRLSYIRTDIEVYKSRLNSIDSLASYSTINIDITEVKPEELIPVSDDLGTRIKNSFTSSVNAVVRFFEAVAVFLAAAVVPLFILAVPVVAAIIIWKLQVRKKKKAEKGE